MSACSEIIGNFPFSFSVEASGTYRYDKKPIKIYQPPISPKATMKKLGLIWLRWFLRQWCPWFHCCPGLDRLPERIKYVAPQY